MIVCSCNYLSDTDVRAVLAVQAMPRTPGQVFGCLARRSQCGRCTHTIKRIIDEKRGSAKPAHRGGFRRRPVSPRTSMDEFWPRSRFLEQAYVDSFVD
jgi:bacterioferritin-associated ferredoxin